MIRRSPALVGTSNGFTLVELLVVLVVVAVLMGILFPVFATARRHAQQTTCVSNLRQLGQAVFIYAQDYDEQFPNGGDPVDINTGSWAGYENGKYWPQIRQMQINHQYLYNVMSSYVTDKNIWRCPSDNGFTNGGAAEDVALNAGTSCFNTFGMSYGYTTLLTLDRQTISGVRVWSQAPPYSERDPVDVPILYDEVGRWHGGNEYGKGRINMVMVDGHAMTVSRSYANQLNSIVFTIPTPGP